MKILIMKLLLLFSVLVGNGVFLLPLAEAAQGLLLKNFERDLKEWKTSNEPEVESGLTTCHIEHHGISFLCRNDWVNEKDGDVSLVVVSTDPLTMITIRRPDDRIKFLAQLSKMYFEDKGWYMPGFQKSDCHIAGQKAVCVRGFPADNSEVRVTDYYVMRGNKLTGIFFSVYPKSRWDEAKFVIEDIITGFSIGEDQVAAVVKP